VKNEVNSHKKAQDSQRCPPQLQERTYSADSLMAAFEKGSKVSPKGTEIVFRDVVVESKKSKVIFKSSDRGCR